MRQSKAKENENSLIMYVFVTAITQNEYSS